MPNKFLGNILSCTLRAWLSSQQSKPSIGTLNDDGRGESNTRLAKARALTIIVGCTEPLLSSHYKFVAIEAENKKGFSLFSFLFFCI